GLLTRPAVARIDQPQFRKAEIGHGARYHADILAKLRLDKNDYRPCCLRFLLVLAGRHVVQRMVWVSSVPALPYPAGKMKAFPSPRENCPCVRSVKRAQSGHSCSQIPRTGPVVSFARLQWL